MRGLFLIAVLVTASATVTLAIRTGSEEAQPALVAPVAPVASAPSKSPAPAMFAAPAGTGAPAPRASAKERHAEAVASLTATGPRMAREGRLRDWWRSGQAQCAELGIGDCPRWLLAAIAAWPDPRAAGIAARAIERLPAVDEAQSHLVQRMDTPLSLRLQRLSAVREAHMGRDEARAWFGREQAQVGFIAAVNEFAAGEAAGMPMASRLAHVEALRAAHYGAFYDELRAAEGPMGRYSIELGLARLDPGVDPRAVGNLRDRLLAQHFPGERAREIAQLDARNMAHRERRGAYAAELATLQGQYPDPANQDYLTKLDRLRQEYFN